MLRTVYRQTRHSITDVALFVLNRFTGQAHTQSPLLCAQHARTQGWTNLRTPVYAHRLNLCVLVCVCVCVCVCVHACVLLCVYVWCV